MSFKLTTSQAYELARLLSESDNKKLNKRLMVISLRHYGYSLKEISKIQGVSERSISSWIKLFEEGGFDALLTRNYPSSKNSRLEPHLPAIRSFLQQNPKSNVENIQCFLKDKCKLEVEYSWLYRYLKKKDII